jgi:hypothetical protein
MDQKPIISRTAVYAELDDCSRMVERRNAAETGSYVFKLDQVREEFSKRLADRGVEKKIANVMLGMVPAWIKWRSTPHRPPPKG